MKFTLIFLYLFYFGFIDANNTLKAFVAIADPYL